MLVSTSLGDCPCFVPVAHWQDDDRELRMGSFEENAGKGLRTRCLSRQCLVDKGWASLRIRKFHLDNPAVHILFDLLV